MGEGTTLILLAFRVRSLSFFVFSSLCGLPCVAVSTLQFFELARYLYLFLAKRGLASLGIQTATASKAELMVWLA
jgi:hypothetical protein